MLWALRSVNVFSGTWGTPGCTFEITDPPVYEVDPVTRQCRKTLQVFRTVDATGGIIPIPTSEARRDADPT